MQTRRGIHNYEKAYAHIHSDGGMVSCDVGRRSPSRRATARARPRGGGTDLPGARIVSRVAYPIFRDDAILSAICFDE
jgi:hypothetical protein